MAAQIRDALGQVQAPNPEVTNVATAATSISADQVAPSTASKLGATQGPSPKTEPRTWTVDPWHGGDHLTISSALAAAQPGDRIVVRPGLYREGLVIEKPVQIIGDGPAAEVVVAATGQDAILFKAAVGRVANLTLHQLGGGEWDGVDITQGRLELEDCDISSEGRVGAGIHGGADPRIRRCRVQNCKIAGVYVYDRGRGTLEDNEIFGNGFSGVGIATGGHPTLRKNTIRDNKQIGVHVYEQGRGTLEDNEIVGNGIVGVQITTGGDPTLRENRITKNSDKAIRVLQSGGGTFEDNDLRGNTRGAWDISRDSASKVKRARNKE
jgi:F-box protein 11